MVRLEEPEADKLPPELYNFNSYMVRLEEEFHAVFALTIKYFNSYMVRLEERSRSSSGLHLHISIPIWCD